MTTAGVKVCEFIGLPTERLTHVTIEIDRTTTFVHATYVVTSVAEPKFETKTFELKLMPVDWTR